MLKARTGFDSRLLTWSRIGMGCSTSDLSDGRGPLLPLPLLTKEGSEKPQKLPTRFGEEPYLGRALFGKNLCEWMNLDPFKNSIYNIGVFLGKRFSFRQRLGFDDNETASFVCEGTRAYESPLVLEFLQTFEVCWSVRGSFGLPFRPVPADYDKFHWVSGSLCCTKSVALLGQYI